MGSWVPGIECTLCCAHAQHWYACLLQWYHRSSILLCSALVVTCIFDLNVFPSFCGHALSILLCSALLLSWIIDLSVFPFSVWCIIHLIVFCSYCVVYHWSDCVLLSCITDLIAICFYCVMSIDVIKFCYALMDLLLLPHHPQSLLIIFHRIMSYSQGARTRCQTPRLGDHFDEYVINTSLCRPGTLSIYLHFSKECLLRRVPVDNTAQHVLGDAWGQEFCVSVSITRRQKTSLNLCSVTKKLGVSSCSY